MLGLGEGRGRLAAHERKVSILDDKNVLKWIVVTVSQLSEPSENHLKRVYFMVC